MGGNVDDGKRIALVKPTEFRKPSNKVAMAHLKLDPGNVLSSVHQAVDLASDGELVLKRGAQEDASRRDNSRGMENGTSAIYQVVGTRAEGDGRERPLCAQEPGRQVVRGLLLNRRGRRGDRRKWLDGAGRVRRA